MRKTLPLLAQRHRQEQVQILGVTGRRLNADYIDCPLGDAWVDFLGHDAIGAEIAAYERMAKEDVRRALLDRDLLCAGAVRRTRAFLSKSIASMMETMETIAELPGHLQGIAADCAGGTVDVDTAADRGRIDEINRRLGRSFISTRTSTDMAAAYIRIDMPSRNPDLVDFITSDGAASLLRGNAQTFVHPRRDAGPLIHCFSRIATQNRPDLDLGPRLEAYGRLMLRAYRADRIPGVLSGGAMSLLDDVREIGTIIRHPGSPNGEAFAVIGKVRMAVSDALDMRCRQKVAADPEYGAWAANDSVVEEVERRLGRLVPAYDRAWTRFYPTIVQTMRRVRGILRDY